MEDLKDLGFINRGQGQMGWSLTILGEESGGEAMNVGMREG